MASQKTSTSPKSSDTRKIQSAGNHDFRFFQKPRSPYLHVRVMVEGKRRQFSTGQRTQKAAQSKAIAILADIRSRGFEEAISLHGKKKEPEALEADPTLDALVDTYESNLSFFDTPPSPKSAHYYSNMLKRIGKLAGASRVSELTPDAIRKAKVAYLKKAEQKGRDRDSAVVTLAGIIRNAAAVFSRQSLEAFRQQGLELTNPFVGSIVRGIKMKTYSPMPRKVVNEIWTISALLLSGDPKAGKPSDADPSNTDFRKPQPAVFALLILELGLGLRRNEADKARWEWFFVNSDGRRYLEVRKAADFNTKSKQSRVIPVAEEVWSALAPLQYEGATYVVPGPERLESSDNVTRTYRCDRAHRALVFWLRKQGVNDPKPCHALRKEFGSYVATQFSLFHAQKLLGHSTPAVTSAHYASLIDLPDLQPTTMGHNRSNNDERR